MTAASQLARIVNSAVQGQQGYLVTSCPVRTGRLQRSIRLRGGINIRQGRGSRRRQRFTVQQSVLSGDTPYMQYVDRYRFIIQIAESRIRRALQGKQITMMVEVDLSDYVKRLGRLFNSQRRIRGRATSPFSFSYSFVPRRRQNLRVRIRVPVSRLVQIGLDDAGLRIFIRYPRTLIPPRVRL